MWKRERPSLELSRRVRELRGFEIVQAQFARELGISQGRQPDGLRIKDPISGQKTASELSQRHRTKLHMDGS
jgi:hypothetical protein